MLSIAVKRLVLIGAAAVVAGWCDAAPAARTDGEAAVVAKLYKDFAWQAVASQADLFGDDLSHQNKGTLEKYFAPELADLLVKDAACQVRYQGICNLDFDLLFDSQDPRVTDLDVETTSPGHVSIVYKDPVDDRKTRIDFDMARVAGNWKIKDVIYRSPDKVSLKTLLSRPMPKVEGGK
jgi:hypothetical protein